MTKKTFLSIAMVFLGLLAGTNTAWAQQEGDQKTYLGALQAQSSPASTGSGKVQLTWLDITGKPMTSDIAQGIQPTNPVGPDAKVQSLCGTMFAMDGVEMAVGDATTQVYMTSFAYFEASGFPDNGSYLDDWTFTDARITRAESIGDAHGGVYFKLLPDTNNHAYYPSGDLFEETIFNVKAHPNNVYAVFKKFLLSNPVAASGSLDATPGATATLNVSEDVEGDVSQLKEAYADFAFPATTFADDTEGTWTWAHAATPSENISATKKRYHFVVTYTAKSDVTGTHKATFQIGMQGAAALVLNISLSVNALDSERPEASWFDGKTGKESGNLTDMLDVDITSYENPILRLNKPVADDLTFSEKDFTLDLNGNSTPAININSGNVTIAYSKYGGEATSLTVNGGKAILNGGTFGSLTIANGATVEQNGATITGAANNKGTLVTNEGLFNAGLTSSNILTVNNGTFKGETAITISGGTAAINRGTIEGTACGLNVTGGTATVKKLAAIKGGTCSAQQDGTGQLIIECGKFDGPLNGTIDFTSGYFKTNDNYGISTVGLDEMLVSAGTEYNEGYRYFLGTAEAAVVNGAGVCRIGDVSYATLEAALAYANNKPNEEVVIFMTNNYTLPAGYYTLPAKATLVVPMSDTQAKEVNMNAPRVSFHDADRSHPYVEPTEFRRLTFANGVKIDVFGDIELTGTQFSSNEAYTSQPYGPYGRLVMEEGSHMTLQSGSELRAWGFMTGKGETDARRGSKVREMFQMGDWKGAFTSVKITGMMPSLGDDSNKKIFPVTQYFIQNIESPVKYHPGAVLSTSATVAEGVGFLAVSMTAADIKIVGVSGTDQAIFLMDIAADADNTWVRKWYDASEDQQVYEVNSGAHIGSMVLDMGELSYADSKLPVRLNSAKFDLPITSNFKIHLLSGTMDFKQNTSLLPGSEVEVDKESTVTVAKDNNDPEHTGALYVYDAAQWDKYAYCNVAVRNGDNWTSQTGTAYTKVVRYAPSWNGRPTKRDEQTCPGSAAINVKGTFKTDKGYVYTSEGGANIFSNNADAGTFIFNQSAESAGTREVNQVLELESGTYEAKTFYPARLKNGIADPAYANTSEAQKDDAYCYMDNKWTTMINEDCFVKDNYGVYYAKPSEYVALANGTTANDDYTYSDKAGTGRLFILAQGEQGTECQWWEVEKRDNLYYCKKSDMYYVYEDTWTEKRFTITWKNWDGNIVPTANADGNLQDYDIVKYGTMAEFLGTNPTREPNIDYTYDFTGWSPALGKVTSDVTYTATYNEQPRKYTVIFLNEGGTEIERQFLTHNEVPVCENTPTKVGHTLVWEPAIAAVTGDATYRATWLEEPPTEYEIRFVDYDGSTELKKGNVAVGTMPTPPTNPSGKPETSEFSYVFDHWAPTVTKVTQAMTYTAVYREVAKTYTIIFQDENGEEIERHEYPYGATPVCSAMPTKENTAQYTYSFAWTPQIQTVMDETTYRAVFTPTTNKYTITLRSTNDAVCTFGGAGIYDYGTPITISIDLNTDGDVPYEFQGWEEWDDDMRTSINIVVTEDITLTAKVVREDVAKLPNLELGISDESAVPDAGTFNLNNLILVSDGENSAQLRGYVENVKIWGDAFFIMDLPFEANIWYAVAVPWQVKVSEGIMIDDNVLRPNVDFYLISYDGELRAKQGKVENCWVFANNNDIMQPGKLYMIYMTNYADSLMFKKIARAPLQTKQLNVQAHPSTTANGDVDAGWNGIANPALFHAFLNAGATDNYTALPNWGQIYIPGVAGEEERYEAIDMTVAPLIVGAPIFVQVAAGKSVVAYDNWSDAAAHAPRRAPIVDNAYYEVQISAGENYTDRLYLLTMEDKEDRYVIGMDVAKAGISTKVAQMWVDRYNTKLCVNTTAPVGKTATYPLGISVPENGTYQISSATEMQNNQELYVTRNGKAIWNLAYGPYIVTLDKGTYSEYGIKLIQSNAPAVTTGVDQTTNDKQQIQKVIIDNHVYIVREGELYTITGQKVE